MIKIISALSEESSGVIKREDGSRAQRKLQLPRWSIINDSNFINSYDHWVNISPNEQTKPAKTPFAEKKNCVRCEVGYGKVSL